MLKRIFAFALSGFLAAAFTPAFANNDMHMVPVLAQPIARGDIIREESVVFQEMKRSPAGIDYITSSENMVGLAAKRPLRAGVPLRNTDLTQPKIVKKGELVTVAFEAPGISLTVRGKALEDGVLGQSLKVVNTQTNRAFEAVVLAAGYVSVSPSLSPVPVPAQAAEQTSRLEYSAPAAYLKNN